MPDGEVLAAATHPPSPGGRLAHEGGAQMVEFGQTGGGDSGCKTEEEEEKDPRKIARKYQLDLCKKALEENIIVYLETGCGKTHIAVLLIYELSHLIRQPQKNVCVFLAPTVALVQQQARVIEDSTGFKVRVYSGGTNLLKSHHNWANDIEEFEVLVMTPQILLHSLYHCFIRMDSIALLIFDECHHAQVKSSHPYAEIMKQFYKANESKRPRIFGMTASPIVGKGASEPESLPKSLNSLEKLLDAKVHSVEDKEELERYVASPVVRVYKYASTQSGTAIYSQKLNEIKHQCILALRNMKIDLSSIQSTKRLICRMHDNIMFSLDNLGLWGALQAAQLFSSADFSEFNALPEDGGNPGDHSFWNRYLAQVADALSSDCKRDGISGVADVEILKEPFFSKKILRLIGILSTCSFQQDMKCIIFVNRIITARSLSYILQNLKFLSSWKCHFLVGVHAGHKHMSRKMMKIILEKFRTGKLNLLVATKVGEEGLDIQTCCLVIRFDLPETVASFIQSRGRARMVQSEYAFLVDSGNQKEVDLIESFKEKEEKINVEIASRTSTEVLTPSEGRIYKVGSSGASISAGYAVSLLHHYCSKLPRDEYFDPKPNFYYIDDVDGTICHVMLPANAPLHEIVGMPQPSLEAAKKDVSLKAIEELHKMGALNSYLLPEQGSSIAEGLSDSSDDEDLAGVLHEMRVPLVLKEAWTDIEYPILNCYHIKFKPIPEDRSYREFCLFVKAPLPKEAEGMEIDLHLAHGRYVMTKIVPLGTAVFSKEEIKLAEYFQELLFKVVLDRSELVPEFVPLGEKVTCNSSSSTFYLLLPAVLNDHGDMLIDWKIIRRCLSSPIFKNLAEATRKETNPSDINLFLANGCQNINNVKNSFIYVPCKNMFCFVSDISDVKNGHSPYKDSETRSHMQHVIQMHGIHLEHPEQPLLHLKPLPSLHNLLHNRKQDSAEARELEEYFIDLPPELCQLKIIGFSKDIGSSVSLLPSVMHRLENLLVAIDLKHTLSMSFPEGAEVTASRVLEALTTEKCQERFSLERLEVLGDAFLKYIVGRHLFLLHDTLDEGKLTDERSKAVNNNNLFKMATKRNLQVYIRDQPFDPHQFFAFGYPCLVICSKETESAIHSETNCCVSKNPAVEVRCSKGHHKLRNKTIADVVEALVGAFLVDSGFKAAASFLEWIGIRVDFEASQVINACLASKRFMPLADYMDIEALEALLGYRFLHKGLLLQAFVHPSYNKHGGGCYQRLEFLGDALLDFLITSYLFTAYPKLKPGEFTDLRSASASNNALANVAVDRSFQKFLISDSSILSEAVQNYVEFVGSSSERGSLDGPKCPKVLGDLVESCFGAILLDAGLDLDRVWTVMLSFLDPTKNVSSAKLQPLRELRELCQSYNWDLQFPDSKNRGSFLVEAKVETKKDGCVTASAINKNRRAAAGIASERVLEKLKDLGYKLESKSLGETLKATCKMDARLIGYDETPIDFSVPDDIWFSELKLSESFESGNNSVMPCMSNAADFGLQQLSLNKPESSSVVMTASADSDAISNRRTKQHCKGKFLKGTARSRLYEICSAFYWKPPLFECCEAEGPSHLPQFSYKITMEIEEVSDMVLECYGDSKAKKKAAAESAAEAAIWYLQKKGYLE